ncbi:MAG: hypothetical protein P1R58_10950 [bacterium]|nr:hypothetical protein [bacterium]
MDYSDDMGTPEELLQSKAEATAHEEEPVTKEADDAEEIPESIDPEAEPVDPSESDEETDPEPDPIDEDPIQRIFKEEGLEKQFADPIDALRRIKDQNRYIDVLVKQQKANEARLAEARKPEEKPFEPEYLDPQAIEEMNKLGFVRKSDVESQLSEIQSGLTAVQQREGRRDAADYIESIDPGLKAVASAVRLGHEDNFPKGKAPLWDAIQDVVQQHPELANANMSSKAIMELILPIAKQRVSAPAVKPSVDPVSEDKKRLARTTKGQKPAGPDQPPDYNKMSPDGIFKWHEKRGLIGT